MHPDGSRRVVFNRLQTPCDWCGKQIWVFLSQSLRKYCSTACYHEAIRNRTVFPACEVCGGPIGGRENFRRADRGRRFCSLTCYRQRPPLPELVRFYAQVDLNSDSPCHRWVGAAIQARGRFKSDAYGVEVAHRTAFRLWHGREPAPVLHHACGHGWCVNPDHLVELADNTTHLHAHHKTRPR
jgi:hypothetical protein